MIKVKQQPFKINVSALTSEMLGKEILGKLETTEFWIVPIYNRHDTTTIYDARITIAQIIASNILDKYQPLLPINFYALADLIINSLDNFLEEFLNEIKAIRQRSKV